MLKYRVKPETTPNKDYKTQIKEILSISSLAYLLSPIRSKRFCIKIIWTVFLTACFFASIFYVALNILDYLQYDTTTSIYEINESESEFPTVSICSISDRNLSIKIIFLRFQNVILTEENQNHIESFTDSEYGTCFRFNSGQNMLNESIPIKKAKKSGLNGGLWINFFLNSSLINDDILIIHIHNYTQMPATIYQKGHFIQRESKNYFIIKRIYDQKLELPYNNCYKNVSKSDFNQTIISYFKEKNRAYTQKECLFLCENLKFNEKNPCNFISYNLDLNIFDEADNLTISRCIEKYFKNLSSNECVEKQTGYCPLECDSFSYDINKDSVMVKNISKEFDYFNTNDNVSRAFYALRVYYDDLKFTLIRQQPKIELFGLISNIGGTLGLFIGFSFISLLELFEVFAELMFIRFE
jgi:hypothetical protein